MVCAFRQPYSLKKEEGKLGMGEKKLLTCVGWPGMITVLAMSTWLQHQPQEININLNLNDLAMVMITSFFP